MTTNPLAAIRERADKREYRIVYNERSDEEQVDPQVYADIAALLAIVDELTARAEAAEAALRPFADCGAFFEHPINRRANEDRSLRSFSNTALLSDYVSNPIDRLKVRDFRRATRAYLQTTGRDVDSDTNEALTVALEKIVSYDPSDPISGYLTSWSMAAAFNAVREIAADALAAHDANGESAGNGGA